MVVVSPLGVTKSSVPNVRFAAASRHFFSMTDDGIKLIAGSSTKTGAATPPVTDRTIITSDFETRRGLLEAAGASPRRKAQRPNWWGQPAWTCWPAAWRQDGT